MSHAVGSFCVTISAEYALCKMFPLSHACEGLSGPRAVESRVHEKGIPGDGGSEAQLGLWVHTKHDPALHRGAGKEATATSWLGITSLLGKTQPPLPGRAHPPQSGSRALRGHSLPPLSTWPYGWSQVGSSCSADSKSSVNIQILIRQNTITVWRALGF